MVNYQLSLAAYEEDGSAKDAQLKAQTQTVQELRLQVEQLEASKTLETELITGQVR